MKRSAILITVFLMIISLCSCANENKQTGDSASRTIAEQVYINYLEMSKISSSVSVMNYCHFEQEDHMQAAMNSINLVTDYTVEDCITISDKLWLVTATIHTLARPEGQAAQHFVGIINGRYCVMTSAKEVPLQLQEEIDLNSYCPNNAS